MTDNPSHKKQLASLKRIEGQVRGIINMIDDGKRLENLFSTRTNQNWYTPKWVGSKKTLAFYFIW